MLEATIFEVIVTLEREKKEYLDVEVKIKAYGEEHAKELAGEAIKKQLVKGWHDIEDDPNWETPCNQQPYEITIDRTRIGSGDSDEETPTLDFSDRDPPIPTDARQLPIPGV